MTHSKDSLTHKRVILLLIVFLAVALSGCTAYRSFPRTDIRYKVPEAHAVDVEQVNTGPREVIGQRNEDLAF